MDTKWLEIAVFLYIIFFKLFFLLKWKPGMANIVCKKWILFQVEIKELGQWAKGYQSDQKISKYFFILHCDKFSQNCLL